MSAFSFALTTRQGSLLFYRGFPPLSRRAFKHIIQASLPPRGIIDIQKTPFLMKKRTIFGLFTLWTFEEVHEPVIFHSFKKTLYLYPWPACLLSQEGVILLANTSLAQALGYTPHELEGREFVDLFHEPPTSENDIRTKIHQLKSAQGDAVAMTVSHMITEGGKVFAFLFPAKFQFSPHALGNHPILSQIPLPSALMDEHGSLQEANMIFQEKMPSTYPLPLTQWIAEKDHSAFLKQLRKLSKDFQVHGYFSSTFPRCEERRFLIFLKYLPSHDSKTPGQFLAIFIMDNHLLPATPTKDANPQRLQMLGQLASGIVHDFNNLLTGILGFCDLLLQRHSPEEASFKDIEQIKQSAMRAARLIQQLLAFSKPPLPSQVPLSLKKCIQDLFPLMRRMVGPKVLLSFEEKGSSAFVTHGDASQLEQLLLNLAINARDAMTGGGSLTFSLRTVALKHPQKVIKGTLSPKRYIIVEIKDTGTGIDPHHLSHIFDPFFSTKEQGQGTGLGLSNVLQAMEDFQGGITVDTHLGQGTTFCLYFPEHRGHKNLTIPHSQEGPTSSSPLLKGIRVLLVEDEDPVRLFAARALREKGHEVIEARDGRQALRFLQSHSDIQIIVTDVMMPGIDGPSLAAASKKINPSIKILFVSGYPEEEVRTHLPSSMKEVYFLPKPFALADLVNKIQGFFTT